MGDQGMFVLDAVCKYSKNTFPALNKFQLEVTNTSRSCNVIIAYSATDVNRVTCCHDFTCVVM